MKFMAIDIAMTSTQITPVIRARYTRFPKYLDIITIDEIQMADELNENAIALPMLISVYCKNGFKKRTSAPWHI
jgi:hypothetical protein